MVPTPSIGRCNRRTQEGGTAVFRFWFAYGAVPCITNWLSCPRTVQRTVYEEQSTSLFYDRVPWRGNGVRLLYLGATKCHYDLVPMAQQNPLFCSPWRSANRMLGGRARRRRVLQSSASISAFPICAMFIVGGASTWPNPA